MQPNTSVPSASTFTSAPLRHRWKVELNASVPEVWELVGNHSRLPEYCAGIASVETERRSDNGETRICHFRSSDGSTPGPTLRENVRWLAAGLGYATSAEPDNAFGLSNTLSLVTATPSPSSTLFTWEEYYESADLPSARSSYEEGLADIAQRLIGRFGGRVVERYVDDGQKMGAVPDGSAQVPLR